MSFRPTLAIRQGWLVLIARTTEVVRRYNVVFIMKVRKGKSRESSWRVEPSIPIGLRSKRAAHSFWSCCRMCELSNNASSVPAAVAKRAPIGFENAAFHLSGIRAGALIYRSGNHKATRMRFPIISAAINSSVKLTRGMLRGRSETTCLVVDFLVTNRSCPALVLSPRHLPLD